jgi:hypothetical protein
MSTAVTFREAPISTHPRGGGLLRAVAIAGLAVGVFDAVDGVAYLGLTAGQNPIQALQFIASGALGPAAFSGGLATAGLGAAFHFLIAYVAAGVFGVAYSRMEWLRAHWISGGLAFGVAVWAVMNLVVVPLSAIGQLPSLAGATHGIIGHSITVGLTSAYVFRSAGLLRATDHG